MGQSFAAMGFAVGLTVQKIEGERLFDIIGFDTTKNIVSLKHKEDGKLLSELVPLAKFVDTFQVHSQSDQQEWLRSADMQDVMGLKGMNEIVAQASAQCALADLFARNQVKVDVCSQGKVKSVFTADASGSPITLVPFGIVARSMQPPTESVSIGPRVAGKLQVVKAFGDFSAKEVVPFWCVASTPDSAKANLEVAIVTESGFRIPVLRTRGAIATNTELLVHTDAKSSMHKLFNEDDVVDKGGSDAQEKMPKAKAKGKGKGKVTAPPQKKSRTRS